MRPTENTFAVLLAAVIHDGALRRDATRRVALDFVPAIGATILLPGDLALRVTSHTYDLASNAHMVGGTLSRPYSAALVAQLGSDWIVSPPRPAAADE